MKVVVSACLLGAAVRYDGRDKKAQHRVLQRWIDEGRVVSLCPEVLGGLGTPRPPAELVQVGGLRRVLAKTGRDVTAEFEKGAADSLEQALRHGACVAILKEGSPSCGSTYVHDGTFSGSRIDGEGVTAALFAEHGIRVFSENELDAAGEYVESIDHSA